MNANPSKIQMKEYEQELLSKENTKIFIHFHILRIIRRSFKKIIIRAIDTLGHEESVISKMN